MTLNNSIFKRILMIAIFVVVVVLLYYFLIKDYFTLENLKLHRGYIKQIVNQNYMMSVVFYILSCIFASLFYIPITVILTIAAGFLFGAIVGVIYSNIGVTVGALLAFLTFRYFLGYWIQERYADKLAHFNKYIKKYGYSYLLMLQFLPFTPTFLINSLSGITKLSVWTFVWTTSIGILPGSLIYTFAGQKLATIESTKELFTWPVITLLLLLSLLSVLPVLINKSYRKLTS